ncbi:hypothetical protein [Streptomyces sp. NPDC056323]|uniref:hypothetical protein n=1 Tax=unclassified Streptomyces TaxID=2593676 RepID=UPI0035DC83B9
MACQVIAITTLESAVVAEEVRRAPVMAGEESAACPRSLAADRLPKVKSPEVEGSSDRFGSVRGCQHVGR